MVRRYLTITAAAVCAATVLLVPTRSAGQDVRAERERVDLSALPRVRVEKRFDFDEVALGNHSSLPMYWTRHQGGGFPHYVVGSFDESVGRAGAPSFRLRLRGGSLAYHYRVPTIRVRPESDYQITAWMKTTRLEHARAWISAYYLDGRGEPIAETVRNGPRLGGVEAHTDWGQITLFLSGSPPRATHLGLSVWLVQRSQWDTSPKHDGWIDYQEIHGSAWIDDIEVAPLPHRTLTAVVPGNVFGPDEPVRLRVNVQDVSGRDLRATLEIRDADRRLVHTREIPIRGKDEPPPAPAELTDLEPGLYHARLTIHAPKGVLSQSSLTFARLAPRLAERHAWASHFGIVLRDLDERYLEHYARLLTLLPVGRVKFPISPALLSAERPDVSSPDSEAFLHRLIPQRKRLVATFASSDPAGGDEGEMTSELLDILASEPAGWRPQLSSIVAQFADITHFWQLGSDGDDRLMRDPRLGKALGQLRVALAEAVTDPSLVAPWSAHHEAPASPLPVDYSSVYIPASTPASTIEAHLGTLTAQLSGEAWATVEPLPAGRYLRRPRLADLAKRLIFARWAGAHTVFVPPLWRVRERLGDRVLEPTEDYLVFRTVADALGASRPAGTVDLGPTVECRVFDRAGRATLVVWDDDAPPEGRTVPLYLAAEPYAVDLWGRRRPVPLENGKHRLTVTRSPTFVVGLDTWLQRFRASFAIEPGYLDSSIARHETELVFSNTFTQPISGGVRLTAPDGWELSPNRFRFALRPGESFRGLLSLHSRRNSSAGRKRLVVQVGLDADRLYDLRITAPFELGLRDIDVHAVPEVVGDLLIIRLSVTNRSDEAVSFRSFVQAPGRKRLERLIHDLAPGQGVLKEFVLDRGASLIGKRVWVALRERNGPRVRNEWLDIR